MGKESHGAHKDDRRIWTKALRPHCTFFAILFKKPLSREGLTLISE